jgi:hypothetical protein
MDEMGFALGIPSDEGIDPLSELLSYALGGYLTDPDTPELHKNVLDIIHIAFRVGVKLTEFRRELLDSINYEDVQAEDEKKISEVAEYFRLLEFGLDNFIEQYHKLGK